MATDPNRWPYILSPEYEDRPPEVLAARKYAIRGINTTPQLIAALDRLDGAVEEFVTLEHDEDRKRVRAEEEQVIREWSEARKR